MASIDGKYLDENGFALYNALLSHYMHLNIADITSSNQIDELFDSTITPVNPDPDPINPDPVNPEIPNITFSEATEEQFTNIINGYYNGTYTLEQIKSIWHIGDTKNINITGILPSLGGGTNSNFEGHRSQTITIQIIDFVHDNLSGEINNKNKALITVDLKNCLRAEGVEDTHGSANTEMGFMNQSNAIGGWVSCERRYWCNNIFYKALPSYIKDLIKTVDKSNKIYGTSLGGPYGGSGGSSSKIEITSDKVFLLSGAEIRSDFDSNYIDYQLIGEETPTDEGTQYAYYKIATTNRIKLPRWEASYPNGCYWLRSMALSNERQFLMINGNNEYSLSNSDYAYGLAPAFCL